MTGKSLMASGLVPKMIKTFGFFDACAVIPVAYLFLAKIFIMISFGKSVDPCAWLDQPDFVQWFELKNWLELSTGLDRDSLHIYAGVGVQLAVALIFRRSLASPIPWLFVVAAALANEYHDYAFVPEALHGKQEYYDEAVRDIWNTLLLPSLFLLIAKFWPNWLTGKAVADRKPDGRDEGTPSI